MKRIFFLLLLVVSIVSSCKQTAKMSVHSLNEESVVSPEALIYALPRTLLRFEVEAQQEIVIPGPYYPYAERYLGIAGVPEQETSKWHISDIEIHPYSEPDPSAYYVIEPAGKFQFNPELLSDRGLIIPLNNNQVPDFSTDFFGHEAPAAGLVYTDLSVKQYVGRERKTYYKRVKRDSLFAKVPIVRNETVYKSYEEKAQEAANFIFLIREKRFELLSGMAELTLEGEALKTSIEELNRLEEEYLSLFIGKRLTKTYRTHFQWVPDVSQSETPVILFRFSEQMGVLPENDMRGRPVYVELNSAKLTSPLQKVIRTQPKVEDLSAIYYRMPERGTVSIVDGGSELARKSLHIHQLGQILTIPFHYLQPEDKFIELLYPPKDK